MAPAPARVFQRARKVNEYDMVRTMCRLWRATIVCLFGGLLPAADTGWTLARSAHFEVYSHAGGREARQVLVWFERLRGFLEQQTGVNLDSRLPLRILVFASKQEYAPFRPSPTADAYFRNQQRPRLHCASLSGRGSPRGA